LILSPKRSWSIDVPASPEDINRRLAEISKELWELDESDFRAR